MTLSRLKLTKLSGFCGLAGQARHSLQLSTSLAEVSLAPYWASLPKALLFYTCRNWGTESECPVHGTAGTRTQAGALSTDVQRCLFLLLFFNLNFRVLAPLYTIPHRPSQPQWLFLPRKSEKGPQMSYVVDLWCEITADKFVEIISLLYANSINNNPQTLRVMSYRRTSGFLGLGNDYFQA